MAGAHLVLQAAPDCDLDAPLPCANSEGLTPLAVAALLPSVQCLELLLSKGAAVSGKDGRGLWIYN